MSSARDTARVVWVSSSSSTTSLASLRRPRTSRCRSSSRAYASGEARDRARRALEMVGLPGRDNQLPASLSGGERQRVTIARALVNEPAIVWADEPTGDLDSKSADEIIELMRRLNQEQQITFAIVTHDIGIGRRADRIIRMADGQIVGEEYPA